jgi:hypothetical protein
MSTIVIRRLLWLALLVALPVPYWLFESGRVPTLWLGELTAFVLAMLLSEGGMVTRIVATLFVVQTLLFVGLTWLLARYAARWIGGLRSESGRTAVAVGAIVLLLAAALLPVYRSPLVAGGDAVNVIRLFE